VRLRNYLPSVQDAPETIHKGPGARFACPNSWARPQNERSKQHEETRDKTLCSDCLLVIAIIAMLTAPRAIAQMGGGPGPGGGGSMRGPLYKVSTETAVKGTVVEVLQLTGQPTGSPPAAMWRNCPRGWAGTHVSLKTNQGTLIVHVGPTAYLAEKNFSIANGDQLTITASKVHYQGSDFLIAKEITKGNQVLTLRDDRGFPLWSGPRRGSPMGD